MKIFEANNVSKQIDKTIILQNISMNIFQGERVAITGSNGSGKSSLLKLIAGIYEKNTGQVNKANINIGYVPEHFPESIRFNVQEYLTLMGKIIGIEREELLRKIGEYAEVFDISNFLNTPLKKCSKGTKQKVGIIQALLKEPCLLLLDEPLTGLDEGAQIELLKQLNAVKGEMAIVFTTHEPFLIEQLAERVIRIDKGMIISDSSVNEKKNVRVIKVLISNNEKIADIPCIKYRFVGEMTVQITVLEKDSDRVLRMLLVRGCSILELKEKR